MAARVLLVLAVCAALLAAGETWLRANLFRHVSYSNSESIDHQLRARDAGGSWKLLFVGDSEVRWGIDPEQVDAGFRDAGVRTLAFNHAFDGFGASWWPGLLPALLKAPALGSVETVVLGVQLADVHRVMRPTGEDCGALQKPVLTSPFASDLGIDGLCRPRTWDGQLGRKFAYPLWTTRHAPAVRALLLPDTVFRVERLSVNSRAEGAPRRGFQPHRTLEQDRAEYADEFRRWKAQWNPDRDFQPLERGAWLAMVADGGYFDELHQAVKRSGRRLALFALPTNPVVIDTFRRRGNYPDHSALLAQWASRRGVAYVDFGLQDRPDAERYFSDMRHLSGVGAADYSRRLGKALADAMARAAPAATVN